MKNFTKSRLFELLGNSKSCKHELNKEFIALLERPRHYETLQNIKELYSEIQVALTKLEYLERDIKISRINENDNVRLNCIKSLKSFLKRELKTLRHVYKKGDFYNDRILKSQYKWTGSITDFVELVYALVENKSINHGKVPIENLAKDIGLFFGLKINNISRVFINIRQRKSDSRTSFLNALTESLNRKMIRDDEK